MLSVGGWSEERPKFSSGANVKQDLIQAGRKEMRPACRTWSGTHKNVYAS